MEAVTNQPTPPRTITELSCPLWSKETAAVGDKEAALSGSARPTRIYHWFPLHMERRAYRAGYRRILPYQLPHTDFEFRAMYHYARWTGVVLMGLTR